MTRLLILGGRGFLGAKIARACARIDGAHVDIASRSTSDDTVTLDLANPEHFSKIEAYDFVIDCADSTSSPHTP